MHSKVISSTEPAALLNVEKNLGAELTKLYIIGEQYFGNRHFTYSSTKDNPLVNTTSPSTHYFITIPSGSISDVLLRTV